MAKMPELGGPRRDDRVRRDRLVHRQLNVGGEFPDDRLRVLKRLFARKDIVSSRNKRCELIDPPPGQSLARGLDPLCNKRSEVGGNGFCHGRPPARCELGSAPLLAITPTVCWQPIRADRDRPIVRLRFHSGKVFLSIVSSLTISSVWAPHGYCGARHNGVVFEALRTSSPIIQALVATIGTYLLTAIGTLPVLFIRSAPRRLMDAMMGFAAGVMVAASCWSLLVPAIERGGVLVAAVGLLGGGAFLYVVDQILPHLHGEFPDEAAVEGPKVEWHRSFLLMTAMTLHNFPEGMAVGVSFGGGDLGSAVALAIGIGLQNIPEGLAIALPLRRGGMARGRAFFWGQLSAAVEPVAGVVGAALVLASAAFLPYGMAAAAGAMLYVVVEELIPETVRSGTIDLATLGFLVGFTVMMSLDNALG